MSIKYFELKLLNDFQEKRELSLEVLAEKYKKGFSTIKCSIENLNFYLPEDKKLKIFRGEIISNINYKDKIELVRKIKINDYSAKKNERINIVLILSFLNNIVNLSKIYENLGLSLTTKKKDSRYLRNYLSENDLALEIIHRKGIKITGKEKKFRIIVSQKLINVIELDENDVIYSRQANNPIEQILFDLFKKSIKKCEVKNREKILEFISKNNLNMDYSSKKLLYIYYNISLIRQKQCCYIDVSDNDKLEKLDLYNIFENENENTYINYLIASFNYDKPIKFPENKQIYEVTEFLVNYIEKGISVKIHRKNKIFNEVYSYIYKSALKNYIGYSFYDEKLEDTLKKYFHISNLILKKADLIEKKYNIKLSVQQISSLTLIFETFLLDDKVFGENTKKIVIITNSSIEKINFFVQRLSHYLEFKMISYFTINEIYNLKQIDYDCIITFSNRISTLLFQEFNIETLKVKFYFDYTDIQKFIDNGFSEAVNKKINKEEFIKNIQKKDYDEIDKILSEEYSEYFL